MIRITKQTDYALLLLAAMIGGNRDDRFSARQLAEQTSLPEPMVGKILKILLRHGILESKRGSSGGYHLAKDPENVSVRQVLEAMEGPIAIVQCTCEDGECGLSDLCPVRENIKAINQAMRKAFDSISIKTMTTPLPGSFERQFVKSITDSLSVV